jgi:hypothetical protein
VNGGDNVLNSISPHPSNQPIFCATVKEVRRQGKFLPVGLI